VIPHAFETPNWLLASFLPALARSILMLKFEELT
jgi:hypothetical protein